MMSRYVKAIPGLVEYPSLKILESQFFCHDGQDLSVSAPVRHSIWEALLGGFFVSPV